jgi:regulator of nonsense transcripts 3
MTLISSGRLVSSLHALSFRNHFAHTILVTSTERPAMPTSTPVLDTLKAEKYAHRDKVAIQRDYSRERDATPASKKDDPKKKAAAAFGAASEAKQHGDLTAPLGKRACEEGCGRHSSRPESGCEGWLHDAAELRKCIQYAAPPEAKPSPWQQASAKTTVRVHVTRSSQIDSHFIFESCPQTPVPPLQPHLHPSLAPTSSDSSGRRS